MHPPSLAVNASQPRRGSVVSRLSDQRDRERESLFQREILDLRQGLDYEGAVEVGDGTGLSRIETRAIAMSENSTTSEAEDSSAQSRAASYKYSLIKAMFMTIRRELLTAFPFYFFYCESSVVEQ